MTSKQEKLNQAIKLLAELSEEWEEKDVIDYEATLSFDEIVAELNSIKLNN